MKITEIIEVFDDEGNKINSIPKTVEGLTQLYFSFIAMMTNNEMNIETKILNILMNRMLFENVDLEKLKNNPNIFQFFIMVERYYNEYYLKHNRTMKTIRVLTDEYKINITHSLTKAKDPKEYDIDILACYIKDNDSKDGKKLVISYPIVPDILPILHSDMRATHTLERNTIMNFYALRFIDELFKKNKVEKDNKYVTQINKDINEDDDYYIDLIANYDEQRDKTLQCLIFDIEKNKSIYNDLNTFLETLFNTIIGDKQKDFIIQLADIYSEEWNKDYSSEITIVKEHTQTYNEIKANRVYMAIESRLKELLINFNYQVYEACIDSLIDKYGLNCVIQSINSAVYEIYYSRNFDILFDPDNDFGERD